jgi:carbon storage regulator
LTLRERTTEVLVLARRLGEKIIAGQNGEIEIQVVEIRPGRVRLGITAPDGVPIHREEVYRQLVAEGRPGLRLNRAREIQGARTRLRLHNPAA